MNITNNKRYYINYKFNIGYKCSIDNPVKKTNMTRQISFCGLSKGKEVRKLADIGNERLESIAKFSKDATYNLKNKKPVQWREKQCIDIIGGITGTIVTAPIIALACIAIKLETKGPAVLKLQRVGKDGKIISVYKLRSMVHNAAPLEKIKLQEGIKKSLPGQKPLNDPRITRVGKFLRKYSIDEFPQLWNVVKGDMHIVGPRPWVESEEANLPIDSMKRHIIKGGYGVNPYKTPEDTKIPIEQLLELERKYIEDWNIWKDIKLMAGYIRTIVTGANR